MSLLAGPSFRAAPVRVRVPATVANLGPGFDALGLALELHDDVVVRVADSGLRVDVAGEGADSVDHGPRNLVVKAIRATFAELGGQPRGLEVICANRVPHGRGLGSSAAAIVAGVLAASELVLGGLPDERILAIATEIEGHPDNVTACLLGGLTIAWDGGAARLEPHHDLDAVVLVPNTKSSTAKARKMLPETVPHADAAFTAGRAALLVEALTRRPDLLFAATEDRLHQGYRAEAMPRTAALLESLRAKGLSAVVAGAGPSICVLAADSASAELAEKSAPRGWTAARLAVDRSGAGPVAIAGP